MNKTTLLSPEERISCQQISLLEIVPHSQRAVALIALDEGATQAQAGERSGLTKGQVKYWLGKFRGQRLTIFPAELLEPEPVKAEPLVVVPMDDSSPEPDQEALKTTPVPEVEESLKNPAETSKPDQEAEAAKGRSDEKDKKKKKKSGGEKSKASKKGKKSKKSSKDNKEPVKPKKKKKSKKKKKAKKPKESKKAKGKKKPSKKKKGSQKKKKSKKK